MKKIRRNDYVCKHCIDESNMYVLEYVQYRTKKLWLTEIRTRAPLIISIKGLHYKLSGAGDLNDVTVTFLPFNDLHPSQVLSLGVNLSVSGEVRNICRFPCFLAHLSQRLNVLTTTIVVVVVVKFSYFHLLHNH